MARGVFGHFDFDVGWGGKGLEVVFYFWVKGGPPIFLCIFKQGGFSLVFWTISWVSLRGFFPFWGLEVPMSHKIIPFLGPIHLKKVFWGEKGKKKRGAD